MRFGFAVERAKSFGTSSLSRRLSSKVSTESHRPSDMDQIEKPNLEIEIGN